MFRTSRSETRAGHSSNYTHQRGQKVRLSNTSIDSNSTYLLVVQTIENQAQNLCDSVKLLVEEAFLGQLVVHFRAELHDALSMPVGQVGGMLALEELDDLVQVHVDFKLFLNYKASFGGYTLSLVDKSQEQSRGFGVLGFWSKQ